MLISGPSSIANTTSSIGNLQPLGAPSFVIIIIRTAYAFLLLLVASIVRPWRLLAALAGARADFPHEAHAASTEDPVGINRVAFPPS